MQAETPVTLQRTCASLEALGPRMIEVSVSDISTILEPSATARATTAFAGFCGSAALGTLAGGAGAGAAYRGWVTSRGFSWECVQEISSASMVLMLRSNKSDYKRTRVSANNRPSTFSGKRRSRYSGDGNDSRGRAGTRTSTCGDDSLSCCCA